MNEMLNIPIDFPIRRSNEAPHKARIVPEAQENPIFLGDASERPAKPIWESPESLAFYDWYEEQRKVASEKQSEAFREFLALEKLGQAEKPRYQAHRRVSDQRHQGLS